MTQSRAGQCRRLAEERDRNGSEMVEKQGGSEM